MRYFSTLSVSPCYFPYYNSKSCHLPNRRFYSIRPTSHSLASTTLPLILNPPVTINLSALSNKTNLKIKRNLPFKTRQWRKFLTPLLMIPKLYSKTNSIKSKSTRSPICIIPDFSSIKICLLISIKNQMLLGEIRKVCNKLEIN